MHDGGLGREGGKAARHAVVEAHAHGQQQVGVADGFVGRVGAVHPEHPEPLGMVAGEGPKPHERAGDGDVQAGGEMAEFLARVGHDHAAAAKEQGAFGLIERVHHLAYLRVVGAVGGVVAPHAHVIRPHEFGGTLKHVFGQVHEHRAGPPRTGQIEGLADDLGQLLDVLHHIVVLGAGTGDARDVHLLKGVVADEPGGDLPREDHEGDGIAIGRGDAGHGVGRAGPRRGHADAHLARGAGVAVGGVDGGLFVPYQNMS